MFCNYCNQPLDTDAAFCTNCGNRVKPANPIAQPYTPQKKRIPPSKKLLLFAFLAIVLFAFALFLFNTGSKHAGFTSMEKAAETLILAQNTNNAEALIRCLPDFCVRYLGSEARLGENASRKAVTSYMQKSLDAYPPSNCRIFCTEVIKYAGEEEFRTVRQRSGLLKYITDAEIKGLEDIVYVRVYYECDGHDEETTVVCLLIHGLWYAIPNY